MVPQNGNLEDRVRIPFRMDHSKQPHKKYENLDFSDFLTIKSEISHCQISVIGFLVLLSLTMTLEMYHKQFQTVLLL